MAERMTALKGGRLIDGHGGAPIENALLLIKGERIEAAGGSEAIHIPAGADVIDVTGKTIMPGLIDAHLHFLGIKSMNQVTWIIDPPHLRGMRAVMDAWKVVDAGFTTVRDCGGMLAIYLKRAIEEGSIVGPRIVAAGLAISQTAGHADQHFVPQAWNERLMLGRVADGVAEVRKAAREQLREGADFLKIMTTGGVMSEKDKPTASQFSMEEIRAFVEEAGNAGVKTATHAQGTQGIKNALLAGIDSIEHGFYLDDECIELMLEQGAYLVPTFAVGEAIAFKGLEAGVMESSVRKARSIQEAQLGAFKRAYQAGVKCGLGTDYLSDPLSPMGGNAVELEMYVKKAGLSSMEAIVCATRNNAGLLGLEDQLGTLELGKLADVIVVDGDPLQDIAILQTRERITHVFKGGLPVPRLGT
ncbi:MAG: amidohydrolase family protein [Anaerolineae bacterium]|nr:MAG: amidohydrolase family protein [Anaerolineae bacterium]